MNRTTFIEFIKFEFERILSINNSRRRFTSGPINVSLNIEEGGDLWLTFSDGDISQSLSVPSPYRNEFGNIVIGREVVRPVGSWFLVSENLSGVEMNYWDLMKTVLTDQIDGLFPLAGVGKRSQLAKILFSFGYNKAPITIKNTQRIIDEIINKLPLSGTPMQDWAMNNRVVFIDPVFSALPPKELLEYQAKKNEIFFPWTSVGLSDSAMVENYMLKVDLKRYSPFCLRHHNPMRNLYQPLGMRGPEKPLIRTQSASKLEEGGISRGGWNWMTAFVDVPLNFEDQIIINRKHLDKVSTSVKKYTAFGKVSVEEGDTVEHGDILSAEPNNKVLIFQQHCDSAIIRSIEDSETLVNGTAMSVKVISVELRRVFKDGFKFTNLHGNKGVAVFKDTGTVYDPIRGENVDIDVIVSAKSVGNRKNFGQIFEALSTMLNGKKEFTIPDDYCADISAIKELLVERGAESNGAFQMKTPYGKLNGVCGWICWGLLREPEDAVWDHSDVARTDYIGIRPSGNKISHIELRSMLTIFGPGSKVIKEILTHQEGSDIVKELLQVISSMKKKPSPNTPVVKWDKISVIDQKENFLHNKEDFLRTIVDERLYPEGFFLRLPFIYETRVPKDFREDIRETGRLDWDVPEDEYTYYLTDTIYIPFVELRAPWQHQSGLWGISDFAGAINSILAACKDFSDGGSLVDCVRTVRNYFHLVSGRLSTKRGMISRFCMSIRYPNSVKGTASVSDSLPPNTIEIHDCMARELGVKHGDMVLVERFPCLGFMSMRVQQVWITNDDNKKYVINVSGSSLNSLALDFDGDVLFLMSFKSPEAVAELEYQFRFPNKVIDNLIQAATDKKRPRVWEASLEDFVNLSLKNSPGPMQFRPLTKDVQSEIARSLIGIKCGTGSSIALGYNILRISEGEFGYDNTEVNSGVEVILDKVGNSVFGSKHRVTKILERSESAQRRSTSEGRE